MPRFLFISSVAVVAAAALISGGPAAAQSAPAVTYDHDVFFFAGRYENQDFGYSFNPVNAPYDSDSVIGGGYQQFFSNWNGLKFGAEIGLAARSAQSLPRNSGAGLSGATTDGRSDRCVFLRR